MLQLDDDSPPLMAETSAFRGGIGLGRDARSGERPACWAGGLFCTSTCGQRERRSALRWRAGPARRLGGTHPATPAAIAWSGGVSTTLKTDAQVKTDGRPRSGESFQLGFSGKAGSSCSPRRAGRCHRADWPACSRLGRSHMRDVDQPCQCGLHPALPSRALGLAEEPKNGHGGRRHGCRSASA